MILGSGGAMGVVWTVAVVGPVARLTIVGGGSTAGLVRALRDPIGPIMEIWIP